MYNSEHFKYFFLAIYHSSVCFMSVWSQDETGESGFDKTTQLLYLCKDSNNQSSA